MTAKWWGGSLVGKYSLWRSTSVTHTHTHTHIYPLAVKVWPAPSHYLNQYWNIIFSIIIIIVIVIIIGTSGTNFNDFFFIKIQQSPPPPPPPQKKKKKNDFENVVWKMAAIFLGLNVLNFDWIRTRCNAGHASHGSSFVYSLLRFKSRAFNPYPWELLHWCLSQYLWSNPEGCGYMKHTNHPITDEQQQKSTNRL